MFVTRDGSYGAAEDMLLVNAADFTDDDYQTLDEAQDGERISVATDIATHINALQWCWLSDDEFGQTMSTLTLAATVLEESNPVLAERLKRVINIIHRNGEAE